MHGSEVKLITAAVGGAFALLGALLGALIAGFFARRTEHIKWLRQNRSETFAEFLSKLFEAQEKAISVLSDRSLEPLQRDIRVTEVYCVPENYARVACLYLPPQRRTQFLALVREVRALHSSVSLADTRITKMQQKIEEIQTILEQAIDG